MTLELDGVAKAYDDFAFGPVDLTVGEEVLCVLGPSGCGKTTLLWLLAGLVAPDSGSVSLNGRVLDGRPPEDRGTGLVFQEGALFPHMTARENVAYACDDDGRVADLAAALEIEPLLDRRPGALSGGERQRVALARTLATDPEALLLDEPLSSLDAPTRVRLRTELHDLFERLAVPVVVVTHDQRTATALGDRIAVVRDGTVEQVGTPADVLDRPSSRFVARFTGNENVFEATVRDQPGDSLTLAAGSTTLTARGDRSVGETVTACVRPARVRLRSPGSGRANDGVALAATVDRWLNEGDGYRVVVDVEDAPFALAATVTPTRFEELPTEPGSSVRAVVDPDAVHLIPSSGGVDSRRREPPTGG